MLIVLNAIFFSFCCKLFSAKQIIFSETFIIKLIILIFVILQTYYFNIFCEIFLCFKRYLHEFSRGIIKEFL